MNRSKKILTACSLSIGIAAGALFFSPTGKEAASNVVLASVDWVNSIVNPINTKVTTLETKVSTLEGKINTLQQQIDSLKAAKPAPTQVVTKGIVNIRKGASTSNYPVVIQVQKGVTLKYISSFKNSLGETWYNVEASNGKRGWMLSSLGEVR